MLRRYLNLVLLVSFVYGLSAFTIPGFQSISTRVQVLDREGRSIEKFTDGHHIRLKYNHDQTTSQMLKVRFSLDDPTILVGDCTISAGANSCTSQLFPALGWYWNSSTHPDARHVVATIDNQEVGRSAALNISARPVVMVHGFISNWQTWNRYLDSGGFLASIGLRGFAVGDGQAKGVLNTGTITEPASHTNTLFQNAEVLKQYIDDVKRQTGAEMVDLIGHSMGGMISRVYVAQMMEEGDARDVAQLIMLGSPSLGSDCVNLPVTLGWYVPASLEIRPSYARQILNPQIYDQKGVPFYALAGDPIIEPVGSPCTAVPSDSVVSIDSVAAIPLELSILPLLHSSMTSSAEAFEQFVKPLLVKKPLEFNAVQDRSAPFPDAGTPQQFSRIYTGHLNPGNTNEITISIEAGITVANFALYDPSLSLETDVFGASGNQIQLDTVSNGLIIVDDPSTLVQMGYGFTNPKPGVWRVILKTTNRTPAIGADYAFAVKFIGGAILNARADKVLPKVGELVHFSGEINGDGIPLELITAQAIIHSEDAQREVVSLAIENNNLSGIWTPKGEGIFAVDIHITATSKEGTSIERTSFLTLEAYPGNNTPGKVPKIVVPIVIISGIGVVTITVLIGVVAYFNKRKQTITSKKPGNSL